MCQCRNKVCGEAHVTQQREHPIITLMNYKRIHPEYVYHLEKADLIKEKVLRDFWNIWGFFS